MNNENNLIINVENGNMVNQLTDFRNFENTNKHYS